MPAQAVVEIEPRYFELAVLDEIALGQAAGERHSLARCGARLWRGPRHRCWWEVTPGTLEPTGQSRAPQCGLPRRARRRTCARSGRADRHLRPARNRTTGRVSRPNGAKKETRAGPIATHAATLTLACPTRRQPHLRCGLLSAFVISGIIVRHPFDGERLHSGLRPAVRRARPIASIIGRLSVRHRPPERPAHCPGAKLFRAKLKVA